MYSSKMAVTNRYPINRRGCFDSMALPRKQSDLSPELYLDSPTDCLVHGYRFRHGEVFSVPGYSHCLRYLCQRGGWNIHQEGTVFSCLSFNTHNLNIANRLTDLAISRSYKAMLLPAAIFPLTSFKIRSTNFSHFAFDSVCVDIKTCF